MSFVIFQLSLIRKYVTDFWDWIKRAIRNMLLCCVTSHLVLILVSITSCGRVRNWLQWGLGAEKNIIDAYVSDTCVDIYTTIN